MKLLPFLASALILNTAACTKTHTFRTATDITPGNPVETQLDWRYGANDLRIQTTNINRQLMDRWFAKTQYDTAVNGKPRILITDIDNRTDQYISLDMIREIFEGVATADGRYAVVVGDSFHETKLDALTKKFSDNSKYSTSGKPTKTNATAAQFMAQVTITKAVTMQPKFNIEDYRMTVTLYDIETQEITDKAWDVLRKKVSL